MFLAVTAVLGVVLVVLLLVVVSAIIYSQATCSPEKKQVSNSPQSQIPKMVLFTSSVQGSPQCRHVPLCKWWPG